MIIAASTTSFATFTLSKFLEGGLISQVFGMLNVQQIIIFMPLFERLTFPKLAEQVNMKLVFFSTFSWIPTELINSELYQISGVQDQSLSTKFAKYDYNSTLVIENMG